MNKALTERIFYTVDPGLPPIFLSEMVDSVKKLTRESGIVTSGDGSPRVIKEVRNSLVHFIPWDSWIAGILHNIFVSANKDFFHYDLDHFESGIQCTYYTEGQFYDWHTDGVGNLKTNFERKLSLSFLLTDDYEGGELEFELKPFHEILQIKAGTAVIFPSWLPHRVKPVTSGERISLVAWMNGPKFK